ncbi:TKL protein kinase [Phytophthora nicotianae INRA-310]|uniref:TKL protein kinase n=2 Tax=Phytophthora nicotianae TaxID=4792 RepID=W2QKW1_PHYN3|nr:TKL protein kinase [Phytophthora nicotianae INRA-310]ETN12885.1 TKL protein kinase [Phytophthora nicotianae INRA-310]
MSLHYTKSGALDMRYSSSRAAVASGYSGGGGGYSSYSGGGGSRSSGSTSSDLHYTKSGALDMRYNSSHAALASGFSGSSSSYSKPRSSSRSSASELHYTKSGALDMRYASSHAAVAQAAADPSSRPSDSNLHYTKSGALDMRYKSSQAVAQQLNKSAVPPPAPSSSDLHYTKSGALDMRYKSSREVVQRMEKMGLNSANNGTKTKSKNTAKPQRRLEGVPRDLPVTKSGMPDLRTSKAKQWVQSQAQHWHPADALPEWVPCLKDGSPDMTKAVSRHFIGGSPALLQQDKRDDYYENKLRNDRLFEQLLQQQRQQPVELVSEPEPVRATAQLRDAFASIDEDAGDSFMPTSNVTQLDFTNDLKIDEDAELLGQGGFGCVYQGIWNEKKVAIKKLHAAKLAKKERKMFVRETLILGMLGDHPNIVQLYGYTLNPVSLVMEYVSKGSLSYLLHYCEDAEVEAKMTDGRIKLNILLGVSYGMAQLHECNVTHGDLKPQNVLITEDFHAKIADFGLATFRAKAATSTSSHMLSTSSDDGDEAPDFEGIAGGTAAYMAPELLSSSMIANEKTDVYSFGVLMNEVLHEEEPYQQNLRQFVGKGPFAAVLFAKEGNRPQIRDKKVTPELKWIIERCWSQNPRDRPTFDKISKLLSICTVPHACK